MQVEAKVWVGENIPLRRCAKFPAFSCVARAGRPQIKQTTVRTKGAERGGVPETIHWAGAEAIRGDGAEFGIT